MMAESLAKRGPSKDEEIYPRSRSTNLPSMAATIVLFRDRYTVESIGKALCDYFCYWKILTKKKIYQK